MEKKNNIMSKSIITLILLFIYFIRINVEYISFNINNFYLGYNYKYKIKITSLIILFTLLFSIIYSQLIKIKNFTKIILFLFPISIFLLLIKNNYIYYLCLLTSSLCFSYLFNFHSNTLYKNKDLEDYINTIKKNYCIGLLLGMNICFENIFDIRLNIIILIIASIIFSYSIYNNKKIIKEIDENSTLKTINCIINNIKNIDKKYIFQYFIEILIEGSYYTFLYNWINNKSDTMIYCLEINVYSILSIKPLLYLIFKLLKIKKINNKYTKKLINIFYLISYFYMHYEYNINGYNSFITIILPIIILSLKINTQNIELEKIIKNDIISGNTIISILGFLSILINLYISNFSFIKDSFLFLSILHTFLLTAIIFNFISYLINKNSETIFNENQNNKYQNENKIYQNEIKKEKKSFTNNSNSTNFNEKTYTQNNFFNFDKPIDDIKFTNNSKQNNNKNEEKNNKNLEQENKNNEKKEFKTQDNFFSKINNKNLEQNKDEIKNKEKDLDNLQNKNKQEDNNKNDFFNKLNQDNKNIENKNKENNGKDNENNKENNNENKENNKNNDLFNNFFNNKSN